MSDYTPTMARIEDMYAWAYAWRIEDGDEDTDLSAMRASQRSEFQRALAAHDRKIAAEALREAARGLPFPQDPYGGFDHESLRASQVQHGNWLRDRADRIEQGGES